MNLHSIIVSLRNAALWVNVSGGNGRGIGSHLYQLEEGEPPEGLGTRQGWQSREYWVPARYSWRPFKRALELLFITGYVRPICGKRSAMRFPRAQFSRYNHCRDCVRVATERGIMALTYDEATEMSAHLTATQAEYLQWRVAGRPDQWP